MVRYGILGFGHHAVKRLVPAFAGARESILAGLWRRDLTKSHISAQEFGIVHVFETAEALCASPEIDAVFVASPDALHLHDVLLALKQGKPVLCEKPPAMSSAEVETMLAAQQQAGVAFGVAQNMRYNASVQLMRQWIAEGRIGKPVLAFSQFCYAAETSPRAWIYDPALALGGPIGDVSVHCIDALRFVLASDVTAVNALARTDERSGAVEAFAAIGLDFAIGAMSAVTVTTRGEYRSLIEVTGETGVISCENGLTVDHPVEVVHRRKGKVVACETVSNAGAYSAMLDSFAREIEGRGKYFAPGSDGLHNQRILDAAYESWRTGRKQTIGTRPEIG